MQYFFIFPNGIFTSHPTFDGASFLIINFSIPLFCLFKRLFFLLVSMKNLLLLTWRWASFGGESGSFQSALGTSCLVFPFTSLVFDKITFCLTTILYFFIVFFCLIFSCSLEAKRSQNLFVWVWLKSSIHAGVIFWFTFSFFRLYWKCGCIIGWCRC